MKSRKPSIPYIIWMVVFTMIPIIMIGFTAFTDKNGNFSSSGIYKCVLLTQTFLLKYTLVVALISNGRICLVLVISACIPSHENERINPEHAHYVAYDSYVDELSAKNLRMGNAFAGQRSD